LRLGAGIDAAWAEQRWLQRTGWRSLRSSELCWRSPARGWWGYGCGNRWSCHWPLGRWRGWLSGWHGGHLRQSRAGCRGIRAPWNRRFRLCSPDWRRCINGLRQWSCLRRTRRNDMLPALRARTGHSRQMRRDCQPRLAVVARELDDMGSHGGGWKVTETSSKWTLRSPKSSIAAQFFVVMKYLFPYIFIFIIKSQ